MRLTRCMCINYISTLHTSPNSVLVSFICDWGAFNLVFVCLHDLNFYYEAFKLIKNWAQEGVGRKRIFG